MIYLATVVLNPTKKGLEDGQQPKVVLQPTVIVADNEGQVAMQAARLLTEVDADATRLEVAVIPFQKCRP